MVVDPAIRQRLLELIYDVLPDDEAAELRQRIEAEPELARAYAQTEATAGLLAEASRLEEPAIELKRPDVVPVTVPLLSPAAAAPAAAVRDSARPKPVPRGADPLRKHRIRGMTWLVSIAAALLLMCSLGGFIYNRGQLADITAEHLRLQVIGPSRLQAGIANRYTVVTTSVTGNPVSAQVQFGLFSPSGQQLKGHQERTDAAGRMEVVIPASLSLPPEARLEIEAASDDKAERIDTRLAVAPRRYTTWLTLNKPAFTPGETVYCRSLTLASCSLDAEQPAGIQFEILDPSGTVVPGLSVVTATRQGAAEARMHLPAELPDGHYWLVARSPDQRFPDERCRLEVGRQPSAVTQTQSLAARYGAKPNGKLQVRCYPEGGELVGGLENRVFFRAVDPQGHPVKIQGAVVDSQNNTVAAFESAYEGVGAFSFEPRAGQQYHLKLSSPEKIVEQYPLPPVTNGEVVLTAGLGVFKRGQPIQFNVRSKTAGIPLVAAAWCRGADVGQRALITGSDPKAVEIPLDDSVDGLVQLVLYDYRTSPPKPVAERLVYRRPVRRLQIDSAQLAELKPGQSAKASLLVTDERGKPVPATLAVSVVPQTAAPVARQASMPAWFLLGNQLDSVPDNLDFFLADDPKSAVALDLLLGTQDRRLVGTRQPGQESSTLLASMASAPPPAMFDNLKQLQDRYHDVIAAYWANLTRPQNALTMLCLFGGLGLILFVAMLAILNVPTGLRLWGPALSAAVACVVIGTILMNPERLKSRPRDTIAFAPFHLAPSPVSEIAKSGGAAKVAADKPARAVTDAQPQPGMLAGKEAPARTMEPVELKAQRRASQPAPAAKPEAGEALVESLDRKDLAKEKAPQLATDTAAGRPMAAPVPPAARQPQAVPANMARSASPSAAPPAAKAAISAKSLPAERLRDLAETEHSSGNLGAHIAGKTDGADTLGLSREGVSAKQLFQLTPGVQDGRQAAAAAQQAPASSAVVQQAQQPQQLAPEQRQAGRPGVLLWNPVVVAGENGQAEVQFDLPDEALEYQVVVEAHADGRLGSVRLTIPKTLSQEPASRSRTP